MSSNNRYGFQTLNDANDVDDSMNTDAIIIEPLTPTHQPSYHNPHPHPQQLQTDASHGDIHPQSSQAVMAAVVPRAADRQQATATVEAPAPNNKPKKKPLVNRIGGVGAGLGRMGNNVQWTSVAKKQ